MTKFNSFWYTQAKLTANDFMTSQKTRKEHYVILRLYQAACSVVYQYRLSVICAAYLDSQTFPPELPLH